MSLLVPVDFSPCSEGLVEEAVQLARRLGVGVDLLHVMETPAIGPKPMHAAPSEARGSEEEAKEKLDALSRRSIELEVPVRTVLRQGSVAEVILDVARTLEPDMIVMGTHGRTGVLRVVLGSVAEHVIRRAEVPVMTVRTLHGPDCEAASCAVCAAPGDDLDQRVGREALP